NTAGLAGVDVAASDFGFAAGFASAAAVVVVAGVAAVSLPHCAFRKSFHFWLFNVPAVCAALYLALHSCMVSAAAGIAVRIVKIDAASMSTPFSRVIIAILP